MEWDEVLYARSLRHYDVATHSPHPPGYPVYVAAAKIFATAGIDPIHATQLVSVMAALLALVNLSRLLAGWGLRKEGWYVALTLALLPVFIFAANLGLTEMLACALSLWGLRRLWVLHERGDSLAAVLFGAAAALSLGARPQMLLLFLLPTCGVLWELSRKGNFRWLWGGADRRGGELGRVVAADFPHRLAALHFFGEGSYLLDGRLRSPGAFPPHVPFRVRR
jgi:hypothetical protein